MTGEANQISNGVNILLTGAAGYVGQILADFFSQKKEVSEIICLDKEPVPDLLKDNKKIFWIRANTSANDWQDIVKGEKPEIVIHSAWQIREMYGRRKTQWKWNIEGSSNVFDFALENPFVKKLVFFSTAAVYGASKENSLEYFFKEADKTREEEYLYGFEKKVAEENLKRKYEKNKNIQIFVLRPSSLTGPFNNYVVKKIGLQSALRRGLPVIPVASDNWCRQFIHEDDVVDIVEMLSFNDWDRGYDILNITPNAFLTGKQIAGILKKKTFRIPVLLVKIIFLLAWHLTRGKIPTPKGAWRFYCYPIVMDGSKITKEYGYQYKYQSREAFEKDEGRYIKFKLGS